MMVEGHYLSGLGVVVARKMKGLRRLMVPHCLAWGRKILKVAGLRDTDFGVRKEGETADYSAGMRGLVPDLDYLRE